MFLDARYWCSRGWLTKSCPEFYDPILEHDDVRQLDRGEIWLLDDSPANLEARDVLEAVVFMRCFIYRRGFS